jgi:hypothetical protein
MGTRRANTPPLSFGRPYLRASSSRRFAIAPSSPSSILDINGLNGRKLIQDAFALIEAGGGWVDYTIVNPVTRKVESKTSYIEPVSAGLVLGCGVYKTAA